MLRCSVCSCEFGLRMTQKRKVYKRKRKHKRKKFRNHQQRRVFVMTAARKCQKQRLKKARVRMRPFSKKCHVARLRPRYGRFMSKKRQPVNDVPCQFFPHWTKLQGGYGGGSHTTKKRRQERQRQQGLADILQNAIQQWQRTQSQRKLRAASPQEQNDSSLLDMVERMLKTCRQQQQQDDFGLGRSGPNNSCFAQRKATELLPNNQQPKQRPEPS